MLSSFDFHISLLSSVDGRLPIFLNEDLWLVRLDLKVPSVAPTYFPVIPLLSVVTVAWYIIDLVRHWLLRRHNSALRQSQVLLFSIIIYIQYIPSLHVDSLSVECQYGIKLIVLKCFSEYFFS